MLAPSFFRDGQRFCEVGCGRSMLSDSNGSVSRIVVNVDVSQEMLRYADSPAILADAQALPFRDDVFDGVFCSLADPYNTSSFYEESYRVLRPSGRLLFSVPSFEWVESYRSRERIRRPIALFPRSDGAEIELPSVVLPPQEQMRQLEQAHFRQIEHHSVAWETMLPRNISPRFLDSNGVVTCPAVVSFYLCLK